MKSIEQLIQELNDLANTEGASYETPVVIWNEGAGEYDEPAPELNTEDPDEIMVIIG